MGLPSLVWFHDGSHGREERRASFAEIYVVVPLSHAGPMQAPQHALLRPRRTRQKVAIDCSNGCEPRVNRQWNWRSARAFLLRVAARNACDGNCAGTFPCISSD